MKKLITIIISVIFFVGCGVSAEPEPDENLIDFSVKQRIHPDMPEFTFRLQGVKGSFEETEIKSLTIYNKSGEVLQTFAGLETSTPATKDGLYAPYGFSFCDWNFDGYLDISLWIAQGGTLMNSPHYFWLWNTQAGKFIMNEQLYELSWNSSLSANPENNQIESFTRVGSWANGTTYYEYRSGDFVPTGRIEKEAVDLVDDKFITRIIISEFINNEWVIIEEYFETEE